MTIKLTSRWESSAPASTGSQPLWHAQLSRLTYSARAAAILGMLILLSLTLAALFAEQLSPYDPAVRVGRPFASPSREHWLGTNDIGQDILSELIYGARVSMIVGILTATIATAIGTVVGLVAGYYPRLGSWLMRLVDVVLTLPFLPLLIILAAYAGRSLWMIILILSLLTWAGTARLIRAQVLSTTRQEYVLAARLIGAKDQRILMRHIWPQLSLLVISEVVRACSTAILLEVSLSFLGLGDPLQKSWGAVLYWAQVRGAFLTPAWLWWVLPTGLLIGAVALGFALLGLALEQLINPKLAYRH